MNTTHVIKQYSVYIKGKEYDMSEIAADILYNFSGECKTCPLFSKTANFCVVEIIRGFVKKFLLDFDSLLALWGVDKNKFNKIYSKCGTEIRCDGSKI